MRHRRYTDQDEAPAIDGDIFWRGVEMRVHPSQLPPGWVSQAINMRFSDGKPKPRPGSVKLGWTNKITGSPSGIQPWGTVYGRGNFKDAAGAQWLITAADGNVYASRSNNATTQLTLPAGVTITSEVSFTQANNTLVMFLGLALTPLVMTSIAAGFAARPATTLANVSKTISNTVDTAGDKLTVSGHGISAATSAVNAQAVDVSNTGGALPEGLHANTTYFARVVDANTLTLHFTPQDAFNDTNRADLTANGTGTSTLNYVNGVIQAANSMPNGVRAIWTANRLWVQTANDEVWASDALDIFTYGESGKFKINQGSVDELVTIALFNREIMGLKRQSVYRMINITGSLANIEVKEVTRRYGCVAAKSVVDVGTDLLWLADDGVASLTLTEFGETQTAEGVGNRPPMFSDPIDP
ncbi:MAG: hypothetical protein L0219_03770, partial [Phycisphaerales bacterium]|nr:hypothetical protein [Phycisphaerales bacterium]